MSGKTVTLTDANFDETIKNNRLVLVDFWAAWCAPCRMIAPVLEEIAAENSGLVVGKLNVDENPVKAAQFQIMSIPNLLLFKDGKVVENIIGAVPKESLLARIKPHM
ncbi:MAG: thioredoxin [Methanobacteriota archaeon]|nr:MAG: thioredoxin [Euryarchaeota archaeon]